MSRRVAGFLGAGCATLLLCSSSALAGAETFASGTLEASVIQGWFPITTASAATAIAIVAAAIFLLVVGVRLGFGMIRKLLRGLLGSV